MLRYIWILLCLWAYSLSAQHHESMVAGADANALGQTALTRTNAFSTLHNQGALAFTDQLHLGVFAQRSFLVEGLDQAVISGVLPTKAGTFGLALSYFGYELYSEQQYRVAYGRKLARNFGIGIGFTGLRTQMAEYGSAMAATFEVGLFYELSEAVTLTAHTFNPPQVALGAAETPLPSTLSLGMRYISTETVHLYLEAEKNWAQPLAFRGGIEYFPAEKLVIRAGTMTQPVQFTFGLGIKTHPIWVDLAYAYHPVLGSTPMLSLQFVSKKPGNG